MIVPRTPAGISRGRCRTHDAKPFIVDMNASLFKEHPQLSRNAQHLYMIMRFLADGKTGELRHKDRTWMKATYIQKKAGMCRDVRLSAMRVLIRVGLVTMNRLRLRRTIGDRIRVFLGRAEYRVYKAPTPQTDQKPNDSSKVGVLRSISSTVEEIDSQYFPETPIGASGSGLGSDGKNSCQNTKKRTDTRTPDKPARRVSVPPANSGSNAKATATPTAETSWPREGARQLPSWTVAQLRRPAIAVLLLNFLAKRYASTHDVDLWPEMMLSWILRSVRKDPTGLRKIFHPYDYVASVADNFIRSYEQWGQDAILERFDSFPGVHFDGEKWVEGTAPNAPRKPQAGSRPDGFSDEKVAAWILRGVDRLRAAAMKHRPLSYLLEQSALSAESILPMQSAMGLEETERFICKIETALADALERNESPARLAEIRQDADKALERHRKNMNREQIAELEGRYVWLRLFEAYEIPRLSLFYMP